MIQILKNYKSNNSSKINKIINELNKNKELKNKVRDSDGNKDKGKDKSIKSGSHMKSKYVENKESNKSKSSFNHNDDMVILNNYYKIKYYDGDPSP